MSRLEELKLKREKYIKTIKMLVPESGHYDKLKVKINILSKLINSIETTHLGKLLK